MLQIKSRVRRTQQIKNNAINTFRERLQGRIVRKRREWNGKILGVMACRSHSHSQPVSGSSKMMFLGADTKLSSYLAIPEETPRSENVQPVTFIQQEDKAMKPIQLQHSFPTDICTSAFIWTFGMDAAYRLFIQ